MASCLALMGGAAGPWVSVGRIKRPAVRITGFREGSIKVFLRGAQAEVEAAVSQDGTLDLSPFLEKIQWLRLEATHPHEKLICTVINLKVS